jgi:acyl-CoA thioester hydrolase
MDSPFTVRVTVRGYELDTQGHLNQAVYLQYAEHARWEILRAAGLPQHRLIDSGVGPVALEVTLRFRAELRGGDEVDVSCAFDWRDGRTFGVRQEIVRADGVLCAELTGVAGLLDLSARKLVHDPAARFAALSTHPEVMGLPREAG